MVRQIIKRLTTLSMAMMFALFAAAASANAQLSSPIRVKIPFDFTVRNKTLPAGEYLISRVQGLSDIDILSISNVNTYATVVYRTHSVDVAAPTDLATLVFHRYGDQYFLARILSSGEKEGNELAESGPERALQRQLAAQPAQDKMSRKAPEPETVDVTAVAGLR
jgi:hypothetical protein